jgi:hypothetical protein
MKKIESLEQFIDLLAQLPESGQSGGIFSLGKLHIDAQDYASAITNFGFVNTKPDELCRMLSILEYTI